jgi:putative ABC transport system permease protein
MCVEMELGMLKNYLTIAWRNLTKQKMYSSIKIGGFALGIAACLLIALYIFDELCYDQHFPDGDRIYRVILAYHVNGDIFRGISFPAPLAKVLKEDYPEVEQAGRLNRTEFFGAGSNEIRRSDKMQNTHEDGFAYADQGLMEIFQLSMEYGDQAHILDQPGTIVISKRKAEKYFPNENPIGKTFIINNNVSKPYKVTGVIDFPVHSHFKPEFLLSIEGGFYPGEQENWRSSSYDVYVKLHKGTDVTQLETKFRAITEKYIIPSQKQDGYVNADELAELIRYQLQPVIDIHLKSAGIDDGLPNGDIRFLWLFGIIAGFILVIAAINFINLSTARSANRAKEVGLRKTVGSNRRNLIGQFLVESVLYSVFSFILGILLVIVLLPYFNMLAAKSLVIPWSHWILIMPLLGFLAVTIGFIAGLYPSIYLSAFSPVCVLKGNLSQGIKRSGLRNGLVIFQFTISIILIVSTLIIYRQVGFILSKKVGFNKEQVLLLHGSNTMGDQATTFKQELLKLPEVEHVTISDYLPIAGTKRDGNALWIEGRSQTDPPVYGQFWKVDPDYVKTMGMNIVDGRDFSNDRPADSRAVILNQTLAIELGLTDPVGKRIQNQWDAFEVIGIVEDFHYESFKEDIGGLCLVLRNSPNIISVKVNTANMTGLIQSITGIWNHFSTNQPIRYTFLDENFAMMYADVKRTGQIFSSFAYLAITIACLGLFALSSFMTKQRTKEIGVRKVLGASISSIVSILTKKFLVLVVLSNMIAWPVAYFYMNKWLQDFAYRIELTVWPFFLAGVLALAIALLTVGWQAIRAATANPVKALRYE